MEKWTLAIFVSIAALAAALALSAYSGATDSIAVELGGSSTEITLGWSLFVLGPAFGPLAWAPLSEILGRRNLYLFTYSFLTLWNSVACASANLASLLVSGFLAGAFGSSRLTNAGGTIADVFEAKERGLAMAIFAAGRSTTGFLGETAGWRWVMGFLDIFSAVLTIAGFLTVRPTHLSCFEGWPKKLTKATGKLYIPKLDQGKNLSISHQFRVALSRPWLLLFYEPVVWLLSLYIAVIYANL